MKRKLVSVQSVERVDPIEGADRILRARVMGWDVVVKKGELAAGDPCVFFEIDSLLPDGPAWSEFMRPRGFRVKTMRLRGVLSQGLALPVDILDGDVPPVGTDVHERLGVTKYEAVLPADGTVAGPFPPRVPKTDEIRLQSALGVLDELRGHDFVITTKLDGTSTTYFVDEAGELVVCSRNWSLAKGPSAQWQIAERHRLAEVIPREMAVQGELVGPGIQKNRLGLTRVEWFVFDAYDTRGGRHLGPEELRSFCAERGLRAVPYERIVSGEEAKTFDHSLEHWLRLAGGRYEGTTNRKEGIVVRPLVGRRSEVLGGRLSFKVIDNDFLLKEED